MAGILKFSFPRQKSNDTDMISYFNKPAMSYQITTSRVQFIPIICPMVFIVPVLLPIFILLPTLFRYFICFSNVEPSRISEKINPRDLDLESIIGVLQVALTPN